MPSFLLTTTHHILAFDGQDHFFRIHSGKGVYYGLAQDGPHVYVSCRNQTEGPHNHDARASETGSILVLDSTSLLPTAELRPDDFALRDVHGIACFDGRLWVTSSFDNLIGIFDQSNGRWTKWYPATDPAARDRNVNHFNTVVPYGEQICLVAHNNGQSQVLCYDRCSLELCSVLELGYQAHDLFFVDGAIATCSSAEGVLIGSNGWTIRTGAFPRGIAFGDNCVLLGLSQVADRSVRHETTGIVRRFTPQWHYASDYLLPGAGMVLAILRFDREGPEIAARELFESHSFHCEYNSLEPGNVYRPGRCKNSTYAPEWHAAEDTHRWTAAREARITVVVNPGETTLEIRAYNQLPQPYWTEVLVNSRILGLIHWSEPGSATSQFQLPPVPGKCEVCFRVPHLWRPSTSLGTRDERQLGIAIQEVKVF
jgi:hypothetical protein